jgi:uncharacterized protein YcbX
MKIGTVREIWRYPVKSMAGEKLDGCSVGPLGVVGDRGWALRDEKAGEIRGAKKLPALMRCAARYVEEPSPARVAAAEIALPGGDRVRSDEPAASAQLSSLLGREVTLCPLEPPDNLAHYRRALPDNPDMLAELREIFGRLEDEPLPDLSVFPPEIMEFTSPLGTYFDAFPLHLLTTTSLATLASRNQGARFDVRRFRPNFLVEPDDRSSALVELDWCGKVLRVGEARIEVKMPTVRCVMTTLEQGDLAKDPSVLRTIVHEADQNLGVYASVVTTGRVVAGDAVELE